jgi:hypothetical protein
MDQRSTGRLGRQKDAGRLAGRRLADVMMSWWALRLSEEWMEARRFEAV